MNCGIQPKNGKSQGISYCSTVKAYQYGPQLHDRADVLMNAHYFCSQVR